MLAEIRIEPRDQVDLAELQAFYARQGVATPRSLDKLRRMVDNTLCLVTARKDGEIVGIARGVADGVRGQIVECKLDARLQGPGCVTRKDGRIEHDNHGIARDMAMTVIDALRSAGVERIDVAAYGTEVDFCEELGFKRSSGVVALHMDVGYAAPPPLAMAAGAAQ